MSPKQNCFGLSLFQFNVMTELEEITPIISCIHKNKYLISTITFLFFEPPLSIPTFFFKKIYYLLKHLY